MPPLTRIGLLGCGSIGITIAERLQRDPSIHARLVCLFDQDRTRAERFKLKLSEDSCVATSFEEFLALPFDLLLECASQEAVRDCAEQALRAGKDLLIMSVGALMDEALCRRLFSVATEESKNLYFPSGAIGGLDLVRAAREGRIYEVVLTTSKSPVALAGAPYFQKTGTSPGDIHERKTLYEGPAKEAVELFPSNVNVAAALSLAGVGGQKTIVKVVADPELNVNVHEIDVQGDFGTAKFTIRNLPHPKNPKTSYLAALSAIETLRRISLTKRGSPPG
ncbi:MAG: aspartate dehydrogenase [Candidatus Binatia bacterium]